MGNICCGSSSETLKVSAFSTVRDGVDKSIETSKHHSSSALSSNSNTLGSNDVSSTGAILEQSKQAQEELEYQRQLREEQARLERIVTNTARDMVTLYGRDGNSAGIWSKSQHGRAGTEVVAYYDASFAAAAAQDILRSKGASGELNNLIREIEFDKQRGLKDRIMKIVMGRLPKTFVVDEIDAVEVLSRRIDWREQMRDMVTGNDTNPTDMDMFLEDLVESFLSHSVPTKERLFQGTSPLVENLP